MPLELIFKKTKPIIDQIENFLHHCDEQGITVKTIDLDIQVYFKMLNEFKKYHMDQGGDPNDLDFTKDIEIGGVKMFMRQKVPAMPSPPPHPDKSPWRWL